MLRQITNADDGNNDKWIAKKKKCLFRGSGGGEMGGGGWGEAGRGSITWIVQPIIKTKV